MTKKFTLLQLFSVVDGRLSTTMDDVYDILNHVTDSDLFTHQLPSAMDWLREKNPLWLIIVKGKLEEMGITKETPFEVCLSKIKLDNPIYNIPQLKD